MKKLKENRKLISKQNSKIDWFDALLIAQCAVLFIATAVHMNNIMASFCLFTFLAFLSWLYFRDMKILVLNEKDLIITYKYSKLFPKKIRISYDDVDRILFKTGGGIGSDNVMQVFFKSTKSKKIRFTTFDGLYWGGFTHFMNEKGIRVEFSEYTR